MVLDLKFYSLAVRLEDHGESGFLAIVTLEGSKADEATATDADADTAILRATFKALKVYRRKAEQGTLGLQPKVRAIPAPIMVPVDMPDGIGIATIPAAGAGLPVTIAPAPVPPDPPLYSCRHVGRGIPACVTCRLERERALTGGER